MDWLSSAISGRRDFCIGELRVSFEGDAAKVEGPMISGAPVEAPSAPEALQAFLRTDDAGRYRPLSGARGMRSNWRLRCSPDELPAILDAVYPLGPAHIALAARGQLGVVSPDEVLSRQSGRYQVVADLPERGQAAAVDTLCALCVRAPIWWDNVTAGDEIPCPEACSVFVALCREVALTGPDRPPVEANPAVPFADFEDPANPIIAAARARIAH